MLKKVPADFRHDYCGHGRGRRGRGQSGPKRLDKFALYPAEWCCFDKRREQTDVLRINNNSINNSNYKRCLPQPVACTNRLNTLHKRTGLMTNAETRHR